LQPLVASSWSVGNLHGERNAPSAWEFDDRHAGILHPTPTRPGEPADWRPFAEGGPSPHTSRQISERERHACGASSCYIRSGPERRAGG
jgi:hypothetical protein